MSIPPKAVAQLGRVPDRVICEQYSLSPRQVAGARERLGVPPYRPEHAWTPERDQIVLERPVAQAATELGVSEAAVRTRRTRLRKLGHEPGPPSPPPEPPNPWRALTERYGGKPREAINRAIRAECPGGPEALDRLRDWRMICRRLGWDGSPEPDHVTAYRHLLEIVDAMDDAIRERWGLPARPERDDLKR